MFVASLSHLIIGIVYRVQVIIANEEVFRLPIASTIVV